jgi:hypothetical protein
MFPVCRQKRKLAVIGDELPLCLPETLRFPSVVPWLTRSARDTVKCIGQFDFMFTCDESRCHFCVACWVQPKFSIV